jgi:hypothetical protein
MAKKKFVMHSPSPRLRVDRFDYDYFQNIQYVLLGQGYNLLGAGASRKAFHKTSAGSVIKVPYNSVGLDDNVIEAYCYKKYRSDPDPELGIIFAPCRLISNGCLLMVFVDRAPRESLPDWANEIDGSQAGYFKDKIVAYDSSYDMRMDVPEELVAAKKWAGIVI